MKKPKALLAGAVIAALMMPYTAYAGMDLTLYGGTSSGNWNPFITDVGSTYAFVGWEDQNIRDNFGTVKTTIYWEDSSGNRRSTTNTLEFTNVAGKTKTVEAKSGNDDSDAYTYHYAFLNDKLSGKIFSREDYTQEK